MIKVEITHFSNNKSLGQLTLAHNDADNYIRVPFYTKTRQADSIQSV